MAAILAGLIVVPLGLWLARSAIATSLARGALTDRGVVCDERFALSLSAFATRATIAPTRCTREIGLVSAVDLGEAVTVELQGTSPERVTVPDLTLHLNEEGLIGAAQVHGRDVRRLGMEEQVGGLILGLSELSTQRLPPASLGRVAIRRGDAGFAVLRDVTLDGASPLGVTLERVVFAGGRLILREVTGTATPDQVDLAGIAATTQNMVLFAASSEERFRVIATGLRTANPSVEVARQP